MAVSDVSRLDDGRVAALVLINEPVLPPHGRRDAVGHPRRRRGTACCIDDVVQFSVVPLAGGHAGAVAISRVHVGL